MDLKHIEDETCFVCGAQIESETRKHKHTNGLWNEYREFTCGKVLHYVPNFKTVVIDKECPNTAGELKKRQRREKAKEKLLDYVEALKVDKGYKQEIYRSLRFV